MVIGYSNGEMPLPHVIRAKAKYMGDNEVSRYYPDKKQVKARELGQSE